MVLVLVSVHLLVGVTQRFLMLNLNPAMKSLFLIIPLALMASDAEATYSIVACDKDSGECGVAVATHNLAVGASVPFAKAGVGAGVSQFETNPVHKTVILQALDNKADASRALKLALANDGQFDDGQNRDHRQIGVVAFAADDAAAHTGKAANVWAGHLVRNGVSVQGNGLASRRVLESMATTFERATGPLAHRLLLALEAGEAAGGQTIGVTSAALLVSHPEGWPLDVDLRVDYASPTAIRELRRAYDARRGFDLMISARRLTQQGEHGAARETSERALKLAPEWDRIWLRAARLAERWDEKGLASQWMCQFKSINPVWAGQLMSKSAMADCKK